MSNNDSNNLFDDLFRINCDSLSNAKSNTSVQADIEEVAPPNATPNSRDTTVASVDAFHVVDPLHPFAGLLQTSQNLSLPMHTFPEFDHDLASIISDKILPSQSTMDGWEDPCLDSLLYVPPESDCAHDNRVFSKNRADSIGLSCVASSTSDVIPNPLNDCLYGSGDDSRSECLSDYAPISPTLGPGGEIKDIGSTTRLAFDKLNLGQPVVKTPKPLKNQGPKRVALLMPVLAGKTTMCGKFSRAFPDVFADIDEHTDPRSDEINGLRKQAMALKADKTRVSKNKAKECWKKISDILDEEALTSLSWPENSGFRILLVHNANILKKLGIEECSVLIPSVALAKHVNTTSKRQPNKATISVAEHNRADLLKYAKKHGIQPFEYNSFNELYDYVHKQLAYMGIKPKKTQKSTSSTGDGEKPVVAPKKVLSRTPGHVFDPRPLVKVANTVDKGRMAEQYASKGMPSVIGNLLYFQPSTQKAQGAGKEGQKDRERTGANLPPSQIMCRNVTNSGFCDLHSRGVCTFKHPPKQTVEEFNHYDLDTSPVVQSRRGSWSDRPSTPVVPPTTKPPAVREPVPTLPPSSSSTAPSMLGPPPSRAIAPVTLPPTPLPVQDVEYVFGDVPEQLVYYKPEPVIERTVGQCLSKIVIRVPSNRKRAIEYAEQQGIDIVKGPPAAPNGHEILAFGRELHLREQLNSFKTHRKLRIADIFGSPRHLFYDRRVDGLTTDMVWPYPVNTNVPNEAISLLQAAEMGPYDCLRLVHVYQLGRENNSPFDMSYLHELVDMLAPITGLAYVTHHVMTGFMGVFAPELPKSPGYWEGFWHTVYLDKAGKEVPFDDATNNDVENVNMFPDKNSQYPVHPKPLFHQMTHMMTQNGMVLIYPIYYFAACVTIRLKFVSASDVMSHAVMPSQPTQLPGDWVLFDFSRENTGKVTQFLTHDAPDIFPIHTITVQKVSADSTSGNLAGLKQNSIKSRVTSQINKLPAAIACLALNIKVLNRSGPQLLYSQIIAGTTYAALLHNSGVEATFGRLRENYSDEEKRILDSRATNMTLSHKRPWFNWNYLGKTILLLILAVVLFYVLRSYGRMVIYHWTRPTTLTLLFDEGYTKIVDTVEMFVPPIMWSARQTLSWKQWVFELLHFDQSPFYDFMEWFYAEGLVDETCLPLVCVIPYTACGGMTNCMPPPEYPWGTFKARYDSVPVYSIDDIPMTPASNRMYFLVATNGVPHLTANNHKNKYAAAVQRIHYNPYHDLDICGYAPSDLGEFTDYSDADPAIVLWKEQIEVYWMGSISALIDNHMLYQYDFVTKQEAIKAMGSKGARILASVEQVLLTGIDVIEKSVFSKTETLGLKDVVTTLGTHKSIKPRSIVSYNPFAIYNMINVMRGCNATFHDLCNGQTYHFRGVPIACYYASGYSQSRLAEVHNSLTSQNTVAVAGDDLISYHQNEAKQAEGDVSGCDQSLKAEAMTAARTMLEHMHIHPRMIDYIMVCLSMRYKMRSGLFSMSGDPGIQMASGIPWTTLLTSILCISVAITAFVDWTLDGVPYVTTYARHGMKFKFQWHEYIHNATFLRGWFNNGYWWPMPSAVFKLGKTKDCMRTITLVNKHARNHKWNYTLHQRNRLACARMAWCFYMCYQKLDPNYPVLGPWIQMMKRCSVPMTKNVDPETFVDSWKYKVHIDMEVQCDRYSAMDAMCHRYSVTYFDIEEAERLIDAVMVLPVYMQCKLFSAMKIVDY